MYYKVSKIRLKGNGQISILCADSSLFPLKYRTMNYNGTVADLLMSIHEGNLHLNNNTSNRIFIAISEAVDKIGKLFDSCGLTWETEFRYDLGDRNKGIYETCKMYADRIVNNKWSDPQGFGNELGENLAKIIHEGKQNLKNAKIRDAKNNITRISSASRSIFEDYVLLHPYDSKISILAPAKDYRPGILKTDPNNIISLESDANKVIPFLTFTGIGKTKDEYTSQIATYPPDKVNAIETTFNYVDSLVYNLMSLGLRLRENVLPYNDFVTC